MPLVTEDAVDNEVFLEAGNIFFYFQEVKTDRWLQMWNLVKKIVLCLSLLESISLAAPVTLATWNIRYANAKDSSEGNGWHVRVQKIVDVVRFYDFDVLAVQEPDSNQVRDLASLLPEYDYVQTDSVYFHPIFYKRGMFTPVESGMFWYSQSGVPAEKGWDARYVRFCSWVNLEYEGQNFYVFNSHWDHKGRNARKESAKLALTQVKRIAGPERIVFTGDLNTDTDSPPYNTLKESTLLEDSKDLALVRYMPNKTFTAFNVNAYAGWQLDHIFVNPQLRIMKYGILNDRYHDGEKWRYPSDHLPVMIKFNME